MISGRSEAPSILLASPFTRSLSLALTELSICPQERNRHDSRQLGGDENGGGGDKEADELAEQERQEALREAEDRRKDKHRKMEEEREVMRQGIRDKSSAFLLSIPNKRDDAPTSNDYGIQKKEELQQEQPQEDDAPGGLNRRKKTPEELAKEAEEEDQDEFTKLKNTLETQVNELKQQIEGKCSMQ
uniref:Complexin n=1 Tax=Strigamia maritima TaxID=126957 RepID=T1J8Q5_STRMM